jgi:ABC-2 type transport system ATP-binding protein
VIRVSTVAIIETHGLRRVFGTVVAVHGVDLRVEAGEIVGLLGPNGAGKTTTLRMLTTLLRPTAGTATVAGADLRTEPATVRRRIGYVAQSGGTDARCRVLDELVLQAELYRVPRPRRRAAELCELLGLDELAGRPVGSLSGGQRRRLDIALGLVHSPALLFLDEPSLGLDPTSRDDVWTYVRSLRDQHTTTVLLTTHYLDEADALCDRLLVMDRGEVVAEGRSDVLKRGLSGDVITVQVPGPTAAVLTALVALGTLAGHEAVRAIDQHGDELRLTVHDGDRMLADVVRLLDAAGLAPTSVRLHRPTLDDVFRAVTGHPLADDPPVRAAVGMEPTHA